MKTQAQIIVNTNTGNIWIERTDLKPWPVIAIDWYFGSVEEAVKWCGNYCLSFIVCHK